MKKIIFIIIMTSIWRSIGLGQCQSVPQIVNHYQDQISILALDQMLDSGTSDTNSIRILDTYTIPIMESLGAVYTSGYTEEIDSVFHIYCINNSTLDEHVGLLARAIYVHLDTTESWTASWLHELPVSGHDDIDSLLQGLDYDVELYLPPLLDGVVRIEFQDIINLPGLIRFLRQVEGVESAERVTAIGYDNHVTYQLGDEDAYVNFILGWDDCLSGCISRRVWQFKVSRLDCTTEYLGAIGNPVTVWYNEPPAVINCDLALSVGDVLVKNKLKVSPNPAWDMLTVECQDVTGVLRVYDVYGSPVRVETIQTLAVNMDISSLLPGMYFVSIDGHDVSRFVKM